MTHTRGFLYREKDSIAGKGCCANNSGKRTRKQACPHKKNLKRFKMQYYNTEALHSSLYFQLWMKYWQLSTPPSLRKLPVLAGWCTDNAGRGWMNDPMWNRKEFSLSAIAAYLARTKEYPGICHHWKEQHHKTKSPEFLTYCRTPGNCKVS